MWNFKAMDPGIPERNPRETEFFRITSPSEAVVREFIQNSLDAKANHEGGVKIKISFHNVSREAIKEFLADELKNHLKECGFLRDNHFPENIPFLLLEDFGTTGLNGDCNPEARSGNFYNFWWREGISEKTQGKAGRWGLGKTTFHIISKIRTFLGLTVRNDGETLLMGKTLLKTHILDNKRYHYFGYFCNNDSRPVTDNTIIERFKNYFGITRSNEKGLSLVIPLPVDEINFDSILKAVIQHFYYPVLDGTLEVEIKEDMQEKSINMNTLIEIASTINWNETEWEGINIREILEFVRDAINMHPIHLEIEEKDRPEINERSFGNQLPSLRETFRTRGACKLQVPVEIKSYNPDKEENTFFTIILKKFSGLKKSFEGYFRSGILVSEIRMLGGRSVAGILIANEKPVCNFLGDCETPAHTSWNERTEGFAEKYINAARILRFIKKSIMNAIAILDEPPAERQPYFLMEIFSIPDLPDRKGPRQHSGTEDVPPIVNKPVIFNIYRIQNGFKVVLNPKEIDKFNLPINATVKMAYDTFRHNPFNQYEEFDFNVETTLEIAPRDCNIIRKQLNIIEIEVTGKDFELKVTGFDPNRDLIVDIKMTEGR